MLDRLLSHQAAALHVTSVLLPIAQGGRTHWPESTELLHLNIVGSGGLQCRIQRLSLYELLTGLATGGSGLTRLACHTPAGAGSFARGY